MVRKTIFFFNRAVERLLRFNIKLLIVSFFVLFLTLLSIRPLVYFLAYSEPPEKSDIIVVMGGSWTETLQNVASLYHRGYAKKILVSGSVKEGKSWVWQNEVVSGAIWSKHYLTHLGVNPHHILTETRGENTIQECRYISERLRELKIRTALITASIFHMRRVKFIYSRTFQVPEIQLIFCSLPREALQKKISDILEDEDSFVAVMNEGIKTLYYALRLMGAGKVQG